MKRFLTILVCTLIWNTNSRAQEYSFQQFTIEDGLPQTHVTRLFQDSKGYMWIGTTGGLVVTDGISYKLFDSENGLASSEINAVCEFDNSIYVGTAYGIGKITNDYLTRIENVQLTINDLKPWGNTLYAATTKGVYYIRNDSLLELTTNTNLDKWNITTLFVDSENNLWLGSSANGVVVVTKTEEELTFKHLSGNNTGDLKVRGITEDLNKNVWVGTFGDGMFTYNGDLLHKVRFPSFVLADYITSTTVDKFGNLWFGTWGDGLVHYNGNVFKTYTKKTGLQDDVVTAVTCDFEGNTWLGTLSAGAMMFSGDLFFSYTDRSGLMDNNVRAIEEDNDGNLWFSTLGGISVFDGLELKNYKQTENSTIGRSGPLMINNQTVYVGTYSGDLKIIYENNKQETIKVNPNEHVEILSLESWNEEILVGTFNRGLYRLEKGTFQKVEGNLGQGLGDEISIWTMCRDGIEVLLGSNLGLLTYNGSTVEPYDTKNAIPSVHINDIASSDDFLCVATRTSGVYIFKRSIQKWYHLNKKTGLSGNNIASVEVLNKNSIVITSVHGISVIEIENDFISTKHYNRESGLISTDFVPGAILVDQQGKVWCGTGKGVVVFDSERIEQTEVPPKVNIDKVELFYGKEKIDKYRCNNCSDMLVLPFNKNHLTFSFDAIHFKSNKQIKFQYLLEGKDKEEWYPLTTERRITFNNVNSGSYVFKVRATTDDGKTFSKAATVKFKIRTPFWEQWWFYFLVVFVFLGIGVGYVYYSRKKQLQLESLIKEKTYELQKSEEKYRQIIESASDTIFKADATGRLIFTNNLIEELTEYSKEELLNVKFTDLIEPGYKRMFMMQFAAATEEHTKDTVMEFPIITKSNKQKWVQQTVSPNFNTNGDYIGFQGIVRDVTEKIEVQNKLKLLTERLKIVNSIDSAVLHSETLIEVIENTITELSVLLNVDRVSIVLFDFERDEFTSYTISTHNSTKLGLGNKYPISDFGAIDKIKNGDYYVINNLQNQKELSKSDKVLLEESIQSYLLYPLLIEGQLLGSINVSSSKVDYFNSEIIKTIEEVSNAVSIAINQSRLNDLLKESEVKFRTIFEQTVDLIATVDSNGEILFVNNSWEESLGINTQDIIGKHISDFVKDEFYNITKREFDTAIASVGKAVEFETVLKSKSGEDVILTGNVISRLDKKDRVSLTFILHDITDRKNKEEIIKQKNQDIIDSISYAQRIQKAILPTEYQVKLVLPDSFVFYEPKEIVSGDFYLAETILNEEEQLSLFGVGDCTGHGVPGAFMSLFAHNFFKRAIKEASVTRPSQALDFVRSNLLKSFREGNLDEVIYDGMDIGLAVIDYNKLELNYSGAYRPLIVVRGSNIIEIKGDRQPIGHYDKMKPFTNHTFKLKKGDAVYLFSDGITDQLNVDRKKFSTPQFKKLLSEIAELDVDNQVEIIEKSWLKWMGKNTQTDDICVVGVRI